MKDTLISITGTYDYFRAIDKADLVAIAKKYSEDRDLGAANSAVWDKSIPHAIENTGSLDYGVIDDSDDSESSQESWDELVATLEV